MCRASDSLYADSIATGIVITVAIVIGISGMIAVKATDSPVKAFTWRR